MKFKITVLSIFLAYLITPQILAGGLNLKPAMGTRTLSLDGLYFAGVDGVASTIVNPAGLGFLTGKQINLSVIDRIGQEKFDNSIKGPFLSFNDDIYSFGGGIYLNFSEGFTGAVSYGRIVDYEVDWPYALFRKSDTLSAVHAFDMFNRIYVDAITPALSIKLGNIFLGLSGNGYHIKQEVAFPRGNDLWFQGLGEAAYQIDYSQDAWAFGVTFGIIVNFSNNLKAGLTVRSGYKADMKGTAKSNLLGDIDSVSSFTDVSSNFEMPWEIGAGINYNLSENLCLNIDFAYNLYGSIQKDETFNLNNSTWQNRLSGVDSLTGLNPQSFPLQYNNSIEAGIGIEYSAPGGLTYSAGYRYSQSPNADVTYSMLSPQVDQHWFSIGINYIDENIIIDASIAYSLGLSKQIISTVPNLTGKYSSNIFVPSITLHYIL
jgi:opacity protein-like surface antigen